LIVWQKAHEFVLAAYPFIGPFPRKEIFCLSSQFRRAAISIPANIAEGFAKRGSADKARFLNIAQGSVEECRYYLILSEDLGYGKTQELEKKLEDVSRLLMAYANAIMSQEAEKPMGQEVEKLRIREAKQSRLLIGYTNPISGQKILESLASRLLGFFP
jgi:four helix bundle protein